jgi:hypothetical protein
LHEDFEDRLQARILRECTGSRAEPFPGLRHVAGVAGAMAVVVAAGVAGSWLSGRDAGPAAPRDTARVAPRRAARARFAHDTSFGRDPFRVIPATHDTVPWGARAGVEITVDWMVP